MLEIYLIPGDQSLSLMLHKRARRLLSERINYHSIRLCLVHGKRSFAQEAEGKRLNDQKISHKYNEFDIMVEKTFPCAHIKFIEYNKTGKMDSQLLKDKDLLLRKDRKILKSSMIPQMKNRLSNREGTQLPWIY